MKWYKKEKYVDNDIKYSKIYLLGQCILKKEKSKSYKKVYFFNKCVKHKSLYSPTVNNIDLQLLFSPKTKISYPSIDIIIPVYDGYDYLYELFTSIYNNTDLDYHLIVINDCSPDKRVLPELKTWKSRFGSKMTLIENERNLGFIKTVNSGFKLTSNHVIILNTDVILPTNWASRLLRPILIDSSIASVTPLSNAAAIFSLPKIFIDNNFHANVESLNEVFRHWNIPYNQLKFPTGVGFCMAINHNTLKQIGKFDEIYRKGYAEENDWCQRAIQSGYSHTLAGDLFVWHKHGGSFDSEEKKKLIQKNQKTLKKRYPNYQKDINLSIKNTCFQSIRFFAELFFHNIEISKTIIWFDHSWKGGTELYTFNKFNELRKNNLLLRIQDNSSNGFILTYYTKDQINSIILNDIDELKILLLHLKIPSIVINNLASYPDPISILKLIQDLKKIKSSHISFRLHDFQCVCPSITMVNSNNQHCFAEQFNQCIDCFSKIRNEVPIHCSSINKWQSSWKEMINNTIDECIVFSQSSYHIITKLYPELHNKTHIVPHTINYLRPVKIPPHKKLNIGVLGAIGIHKGALILKGIDDILPTYHNISVKIIGFSCNNFKNITSTGKYDHHDLPEIIERECIDIILIPSIWPETFSYTTAEAMSMEIPLASFNIGAPAERISAYKKGLIISQMDPQCALNEIIQFINSHENIRNNQI